MNCPECDGVLKADQVDGIAIDRCEKCHGFLIGEEGFRLAKDQANENLAWHDLDIWKDRGHYSIVGEGFGCPVCGINMHEVLYANPNLEKGDTAVELDYCRACKVLWLGEGELAAIVNEMSKEIARMSSGDLLRHSLDEAIEVLHGPEPLALEWKDLGRVFDLLRLRFFVEHKELSRLIQAFSRSTPF